MKKIAILSFSALLFSACTSANQPMANTNVAPNNSGQNSVAVTSHSQNDLTISSGQTDSKIVPNNGTKSKWSQSGEPIDTSGFDQEIKQVEEKLKANAKDEDLKKSMAESYVNRGLALTEARQYASALGDFRRALKFRPEQRRSEKMG